MKIKMTMNRLLASAFTLAALMAAPGANAAITFQFSNVIFDDGGKVTGYFTTTDDLSNIIYWNIVTSPSQDGAGYSGEVYSKDSGAANKALIIDPSFFFFTNGGGRSSGQGLYVAFDGNLAPTGGALLTVAEGNGDYRFTRETSASPGTIIGTAAAGAVPEPATWAMMIGGFGMVGGALRRRKANVSVRFF